METGKEVKEPSDCKVCSVIQLIVKKKNMPGKKIHVLSAVYRDDNVMGLSAVYQWVNMYVLETDMIAKSN